VSILLKDNNNGLAKKKQPWDSLGIIALYFVHSSLGNVGKDMLKVAFTSYALIFDCSDSSSCIAFTAHAVCSWNAKLT